MRCHLLLLSRLTPETLTKEKALLPLTDVLEMTVPGENVKVKDKIVPGFLDTLATNPYGDGVTYYAPMFQILLSHFHFPRYHLHKSYNY